MAAVDGGFLSRLRAIARGNAGRMKSPLDSAATCPCGSARPYGICCEPLLTGHRAATTARELMRSRYTAHAVGDEAYLHRTYLPTARRPYVAPKKAPPPTHWTRLVIHRDEPGAEPDLWYVEFSAFYRDRSGEHEMRERSEFRRVDGQWLYARAVPAR